jgi:large subunit ribosomal protein L31
MKSDIHPNYVPTVFEDISAGKKFLTRSTMNTGETIEWEDGNTYPLVKVEVTSASHPFYTGEKMLIDTAGRIEKFNNKFAKVVGGKRKTRKATPQKEEK